MFRKQQPDVLVVGAGPVGLTAALALANRAISARIVDREWRTAGHSYALALHPRTLSLLDTLGVAEPLINASRRIDTMALYDGSSRRAEIDFSRLAAPFPFLAVLRQDLLEEQLETALGRRGIRVDWNREVSRLSPDESHVRATIEKLAPENLGYSVARTEWVVVRTSERPFSFVVGADGHASDVRRALGIAFEPVAAARHFAVFEFCTDTDLDDEVRVVLDDETTSVLWPLPEGMCRWSFELASYEVPADSRVKDRFVVELGARRFPVLDELDLSRLIAERAPWFTGNVGEVRWRMVVRFERRLAKRFGDGRMWLAGDAAHLSGPVGVQSMNVGMFEAYELATAVEGVLSGRDPASSLDSYGTHRREVWKDLLGLHGPLESGKETDPWIRRHAGRLLDVLPASEEHLAELAAQLGLSMPRTPTSVATP
jgi:2-polyprenyl-6-methoxyphenol hydroxylase-like FAD-dependent oxidoreductase